MSLTFLLLQWFVAMKKGILQVVFKHYYGSFTQQQQEWNYSHYPLEAWHMADSCTCRLAFQFHASDLAHFTTLGNVGSNNPRIACLVFFSWIVSRFLLTEMTTMQPMEVEGSSNETKQQSRFQALQHTYLVVYLLVMGTYMTRTTRSAAPCSHL